MKNAKKGGSLSTKQEDKGNNKELSTFLGGVSAKLTKLLNIIYDCLTINDAIYMVMIKNLRDLKLSKSQVGEEKLNSLNKLYNADKSADIRMLFLTVKKQLKFIKHNFGLSEVVFNHHLSSFKVSLNTLRLIKDVLQKHIPFIEIINKTQNRISINRIIAEGMLDVKTNNTDTITACDIDGFVLNESWREMIKFLNDNDFTKTKNCEPTFDNMLKFDELIRLLEDSNASI